MTNAVRRRNTTAGVLHCKKEFNLEKRNTFTGHAMTLNEFIFSKKAKHRTARHISFWLAYTFYFYLQSIPPKTFEELYTTRPYYTALINTACFGPFYFAVTYFFIYYVYPNTIKKEKYFSFIVGFTLCMQLACW